MSHIAQLGRGGQRRKAGTGSGLETILEDNLCALLGEPQKERLIHRILRAERGNHVIIGGPNPPLYRTQGKAREFVVQEADLALEVNDVRDGEDVFVFGISLGEQIAHLLRTRPNAKITVWDRDPWLARLTLSRQGYEASLKSGRLHIALGADLVTLLPRLEKMRVVLHPAFRSIYADELRLVSEALAGISPSEGRRWVGLGMGGVIVTDLAEGLRSEGYSVLPLEVSRWDPKETAHALETLRPERVITINYDADVARACEKHGVPLVVWDVDPTTDRTPTPPKTHAPDSIQVFTLRRNGVKDFRAAGFRHVESLAIGVDVEKRRPLELSTDELARYAAPVTFVGSSLSARAQRFKRLFLQLHASFDCCGAESFDETEARLESLLAAERADYSVFSIDDLVEKSFGKFLDSAQRSGTPGDPKKWVAEIVASHKRIAYVTALADQGIHVWGDQGWIDVSRSVQKIQYMGAASFGHELTLVYNGADINVDVNRIYQPDVVPIRVFDVLSCGGFLIAEHSSALESLFEVGEELESYRTLAELEDKVAHYRAHPEAAQAIAERGLAAVRARHTMRLRVKELMKRPVPA